MECIAPSCVHTHPGTGLPWPCLCLHTHSTHSATLTSKHALPVPKPWVCGAWEAMPTSVPPHRFMACNIIICGCDPFRYIPACAHSSMPIRVHTRVSQHTYRAQHALPALRVAMSMFALIPCILKLQLFLVYALSTQSDPSN